MPYPAASDRKDLEKLVTDNWNTNVLEPYNSWDTKQLQSYLTLKGKQATKPETNMNKLVEQVKSSWTETEDSASSAYASVRDWVFDSLVPASILGASLSNKQQMVRLSAQGFPRQERHSQPTAKEP